MKQIAFVVFFAGCVGAACTPHQRSGDPETDQLNAGGTSPEAGADGSQAGALGAAGGGPNIGQQRGREPEAGGTPLDGSACHPFSFERDGYWPPGDVTTAA